MPVMAANNPATTLQPAYMPAIIVLPWVSMVIASYPKEEKVVKPPSRPTHKKSLQVVSTISLWMREDIKIPIKKQPKMLIAKVPIGKLPW